MRELRTIGREFNAEIEIYDSCKYSQNSRRINTVKYNNIINWEIITGDDAAELEGESDGSCIDDLHEYLVLHFADGTHATFRNSYADMFRI
jgi:hypothetical protein